MCRQFDSARGHHQQYQRFPLITNGFCSHRQPLRPRLSSHPDPSKPRISRVHWARIGHAVLKETFAHRYPVGWGFESLRAHRVEGIDSDLRRPRGRVAVRVAMWEPRRLPVQSVPGPGCAPGPTHYEEIGTPPCLMDLRRLPTSLSVYDRVPPSIAVADPWQFGGPPSPPGTRRVPQGPRRRGARRETQPKLLSSAHDQPS